MNRAFCIDSVHRDYHYLQSISWNYLPFPPSSGWFTFDKQVTEFIENSLPDPELFGVFIVPVSLTENYLEFTGIRLIQHLRLSNKYSDVPVLIFGELSLESLCRLSKAAQIIFSRGTYYCNSELNELTAFLNSEELIKPSLEDTINHVNIDEPKNFELSHNLDNELTLYRWSSALKCTHELIDLQKRFSDNLFFKYIAQKERLVEDQTFELKSIGLKGKVLLIDDQAEQGWSNLYRSLLRLSDNVVFEYIEGIGEIKEVDQIIEMCMVEIEKIDPDVILLDLKLHDNEISQENNLSSTGMNILKKAMSLNRGFSIIITSADRNANVITSALAAGATSFILKDWKIDPVSALNAAFDQISKGLQKSSYLKTVSRKINQILLNLENLSLSDGFKENAKSSLSIAFDFLRESFEENRFQNYAYLQFFLIIEDFIREMCSEETDGFYINVGDSSVLVAKKILVSKPIRDKIIYESAITFQHKGRQYTFQVSKGERYPDSNYRMSAILMFNYGAKDSRSEKFQWPRVSGIRNNKCGHGMNKRVKEKEIFLVLDFIEKIFDSKNLSDVNKKKALPMMSMNE